jgi:hypothetical protein
MIYLVKRLKNLVTISMSRARLEGLCGFEPQTPIHQGKHAFAQLMALLPQRTCARCAKAHEVDHKIKVFSYLDQFLAMAIA